MPTVTLDEVLELATQLESADKLQLIGLLAPQIAVGLEATRVQREEARARRQRYYEEARALGPGSPTAGEILDADRKARDAVLMGVARNDVHD